jgi:hypothetical protein
MEDGPSAIWNMVHGLRADLDQLPGLRRVGDHGLAVKGIASVRMTLRSSWRRNGAGGGWAIRKIALFA